MKIKNNGINVTSAITNNRIPVLEAAQGIVFTHQKRTAAVFPVASVRERFCLGLD